MSVWVPPPQVVMQRGRLNMTVAVEWDVESISHILRHEYFC